MTKSFGGARPEDAGAAMYNQWECTLTVLPSQMQSNNVPVRSTWSDFRRCWPYRPRLPSPEVSNNARETGCLLGLAGRRAVTICRQNQGLLCCLTLTSAPRQANGRVNRAGPARGPGFSLYARLHFFAPCIPDTKRFATSGDVCAIFSSTLAQCLPLRTTV